MHSDQPGVEPGNGLDKGLLLGELFNLLAGVAADGEAVHGLGVEVDLVGEAALGEDLLGLVAVLGGEDLVRLGGGDGEGSLEAGELVLVYERGVGKVADRDLGEVAGDVLKKTLRLDMSGRTRGKKDFGIGS